MFGGGGCQVWRGFNYFSAAVLLNQERADEVLQTERTDQLSRRNAPATGSDLTYAHVCLG